MADEHKQQLCLITNQAIQTLIDWMSKYLWMIIWPRTLAPFRLVPTSPCHMYARTVRARTSPYGHEKLWPSVSSDHDPGTHYNFSFFFCCFINYNIADGLYWMRFCCRAIMSHTIGVAFAPITSAMNAKYSTSRKRWRISSRTYLLVCGAMKVFY